MTRFLLPGLVVALAFALGCGGGDTGPAESASSRTAEGWTLFGDGDYEDAVAKFERAIELDNSYAEAYSGLGWCYANMNMLEEALDNFGRAIDGNPHETVLADAYAGSSPVYRDADTRPAHFDSAAAYADSALSIDRFYKFDYDTTFNWQDLHLIMAQSYFQLQEYGLAKARVDSLGGKSLDPGSPTFVDSLAAEIERLETLHGG